MLYILFGKTFQLFGVHPPPKPLAPRGIATADLDRSVKYAYTQHINIVAIVPLYIYMDTQTVRAPRYRPSVCILRTAHTHTFINNKCVSLAELLIRPFTRAETV